MLAFSTCRPSPSADKLLLLDALTTAVHGHGRSIINEHKCIISATNDLMILQHRGYVMTLQRAALSLAKSKSIIAFCTRKLQFSLQIEPKGGLHNYT